MNVFKSIIDFYFSMFSSVFDLIISHWLTGLILLICIFSSLILFTFSFIVSKK